MHCPLKTHRKPIFGFYEIYNTEIPIDFAWLKKALKITYLSKTTQLKHTTMLTLKFFVVVVTGLISGSTPVELPEGMLTDKSFVLTLVFISYFRKIYNNLRKNASLWVAT